MKTLIGWLIGWPERVAQHLGSLAPLFARIVVGWVFLWSGWGKLNNLPAMIENFASWAYPGAPHSHAVRIGRRVLRRDISVARPVDARFRWCAGHHDDCRHRLRKVGSGRLARDIVRI